MRRLHGVGLAVALLGAPVALGAQSVVVPVVPDSATFVLTMTLPVTQHATTWRIPVDTMVGRHTVYAWFVAPCVLVRVSDSSLVSIPMIETRIELPSVCAMMRDEVIRRLGH